MSLAVFNSEEFGQIRTRVEEGKPLFLAGDVAKALGYARPADAVRDHCKGVAVLPTPSKGGEQLTKFIPESDVYRLIMRSKLPSAERFQDWVVEEVLPALRAEGSYRIPASGDGVAFSPAMDLIRKLSAFELRKPSDVRTLAEGYKLLRLLEGGGEARPALACRETAHTPAARMIVRSVAAEQLQHGRIAEAYSTAYLLRLYGGKTGPINSVQLGIGMSTLVGVETEFEDESGDTWIAHIQPHRDRSCRKWIVAIQGRKETAA